MKIYISICKIKNLPLQTHSKFYFSKWSFLKRALKLLIIFPWASQQIENPVYYGLNFQYYELQRNLTDAHR